MDLVRLGRRGGTSDWTALASHELIPGRGGRGDRLGRGGPGALRLAQRLRGWSSIPIRPRRAGDDGASAPGSSAADDGVGSAEGIAVGASCAGGAGEYAL